MKPLQHAQISQKTHGGMWQDYIRVHNFLDSSKASCAHFKHRFLLHHTEGIELGVRIFGETLTNSEKQEISIRRILTDHVIEDVGRVVSVEDWARDLLSDTSNSFFEFLAKKREQIELDRWLSWEAYSSYKNLCQELDKVPGQIGSLYQITFA